MTWLAGAWVWRVGCEFGPFWPSVSAGQPSTISKWVLAPARTLGLESTAWGLEVTDPTFSCPVWMFMFQGCLAALGFRENGRIYELQPRGGQEVVYTGGTEVAVWLLTQSPKP